MHDFKRGEILDNFQDINRNQLKNVQNLWKFPQQIEKICFDNLYVIFVNSKQTHQKIYLIKTYESNENEKYSENLTL